MLLLLVDTGFVPERNERECGLLRSTKVSQLVVSFIHLLYLCESHGGVLEAPFPGRLLHAALLRFIEEYAPALSEQLHDTSGDKPFTLSSLFDLPARSPREICIRRGEPLSFRITSLDPKLSDLLIETLQPSERANWQLGKVPCRIGRVDTSEHAWAKCEGYATLYQHTFEQASNPPTRIRLRFVTPTTFRQTPGNRPLPLPELVFRNYPAKWMRHTGLDFAPELERVLAEQVLIECYRLQTRMLPFGRGRMEVGFTGECTYRLKTPNPAHRLMLGLLADYAFYCGTGAKTTQGMGQTCRIETS